MASAHCASDSPHEMYESGQPLRAVQEFNRTAENERIAQKIAHWFDARGVHSVRFPNTVERESSILTSILKALAEE